MKRIILHWTAGRGIPNEHEKECYHYLVDIFGSVHTGNHEPKDNENCNDGNYAAHTGGGNTGSIGVALCGMFDYKNSKDIGVYPLTKKQCEASFNFVARLCKIYDIKISPETILTHYEFGKRFPKTSSRGKIDLTFLPPYSYLKPDDVGDFIRNKVQWYYNAISS